MTWLVWKDFRLNRLIFGVGLFLLVLPYVIPIIATWYQTGSPFPGNAQSLGSRDLLASSIWSLWLLQVTMALVGGNAIACERADRSAEFLAYLPVPRGRILASKLLVVLGLVALIWIPNLAVLAMTQAPAEFGNTRLLQELMLPAATGLTFFCVAWLFSAILQSPTFSVCLGLLAPIIAGVCIAIILDHQRDGSNPSAQVFRWYHDLYLGLCLSLSVASFVGGTFYYLRRVEP